MAFGERAARVFPGGSNGNLEVGVVIKSGTGSRVKTTDGRELIDFLMGSGPMILGHAHPAVSEAVERELRNGSTFFIPAAAAIELAEMIIEAVPCAEQVRFATSGSEATAYALRAARAYRRRDKILKFEGGYHGMHDYALMSMAPNVEAPFPKSVPDSPGIPRSICDEVLIVPFNDSSTFEDVLDRHQNELAAVIIEPLQRMLPPAPGFLQSVRDATAKYEIPLIFDEVVTGFRLAYGGAQEYYGVVPDLCTLGKIVGGGFPLAAVAGRREVMAAFDPKTNAKPVLQAGTLNGNPIAARAGIATLKILQTAGTYERLNAIGTNLRSRLTEVLASKTNRAQIVGEFPVFDVFFCSTPVIDYRSSRLANQARLDAMNEEMLARGVLKGDTKFYVSLAHTDADIDETVAAFSASIDATLARIPE
ncbi:aspartate aminotransferase family protein [Mesorhizobium sp.]|uniref:aspartate aminotransferase family protein n=1 Tax=Mesorhizobium sp. TaxID=1871066 RepID=UPI000FE8EFD0|nr:aspartate aminotransferase family protein [Mesorhizobium sp.]RWB69903.1 MAG: aspartate aminotransferase family protein [Mesorhizobium sp.]